MVPFPPTDAAPKLLRYSAILRLEHAGGSEGLKQWRTFDPPLSTSSIKREKIEPHNYDGCTGIAGYSAPAVLPELSAGLFVLDLRGKLWDRRMPSPKCTMMWTIPVGAAWFNPMVPALIDAGLKPVIFIGRSSHARHTNALPCYEALGFKKEGDMVVAEAMLDELLPPN